MPIDEAMASIRQWIRTVWVWQSDESRWRGWSPLAPADEQGKRGSLERIETGDVVRLDLSGRPPRDFFVPGRAEVSASATVRLTTGFNSVTWLGRSVDAIDALSATEAAQPGLLGTVWQWDGHAWKVIWPRLRGAWDPGSWTFPALWVRATREGVLSAR